jgi:pyruvate/2-oxoglutarate dehydrogenase complex dihydrolipoamide acyltransferase (E2) component
VRAPVAGVVSDVRIHPGQQLLPGEVILSIVGEDARFEVVAMLPGHRRPLLKPGLASDAAADGDPPRRPARRRASRRRLLRGAAAGGRAPGDARGGARARRAALGAERASRARRSVGVSGMKPTAAASACSSTPIESQPVITVATGRLMA